MSGTAGFGWRHRAARSTKSQAPNNKQAPKDKFQSPKRLAPNARAAKQLLRLGEDKRSRDARLELAVSSFGPCLIFGACYLVLI
jgi:hypothetical protein